LLDDLLEAADVGSDALVDLATGPGRIALDLAGRFARVVAIDLEPDMIAFARGAAATRGIDNVTWRVGRAEDLDVATGSLDLVTIGEAFHRLDQPLVAAKASRWLRPGGCLATLGVDGRFAGESTWEASVRAVRDRWLTRLFPDGYGPALPAVVEGQEARRRTLGTAGFVDIQSRDLDEPIERDFDSIVGYLASTSICSTRVLGDEWPVFVDELRRALRADEASRYPDTLRWGYTLARKPR
jgi:ubiquinone/menaquinone biosynthesis C-methylase UbiE